MFENLFTFPSPDKYHDFTRFVPPRALTDEQTIFLLKSTIGSNKEHRTIMSQVPLRTGELDEVLRWARHDRSSWFNSIIQALKKQHFDHGINFPVCDLCFILSFGRISAICLCCFLIVNKQFESNLSEYYGLSSLDAWTREEIGQAMVMTSVPYFESDIQCKEKIPRTAIDTLWWITGCLPIGAICYVLRNWICFFFFFVLFAFFFYFFVISP